MNVKNILITGGAGFIGSHVVRHFVNKYQNYHIVNLDQLTYAGNLENLQDLEGKTNYSFVRGDIRDAELLASIFESRQIDAVIHLAAESHVDRSISSPLEFVTTNLVGTAQLLHAARQHWGDRSDVLFYQISTDEVYGSLGETGLFTETTPYDPRSPYSASKAGADHLVRAWWHTFKMPVLISNCSNNYGPYQFPEKLIPLVINNIDKMNPIPVYGDGQYTRDWLWVQDHVEAIDQVFHRGKPGETYNIGGNNECKNIDLVSELCDIVDELLGRPVGASRQLIKFVKDRPGHDRRYAIDASKIREELGWEPQVAPKEGLRLTAAWYLENKTWLARVSSGAYREYYEQQYGV